LSRSSHGKKRKSPADKTSAGDISSSRWNFGGKKWKGVFTTIRALKATGNFDDSTGRTRSAAKPNSVGANMTERALRKMEVCAPILPDRKQRTLAETLKASARRFLAQFRIIRRALRHPQVPWYAKVVAGCAVLYVFSPIQLIPNFIPIIGQTDDVLVVSLGIKFLRKCAPQDVLDECERDARTVV
jgi:uncharacterized membrane protein YkvA (DUF1232 family)